MKRLNINEIPFEKGDRIVVLKPISNYNTIALDVGESGEIVTCDKTGRAGIELDRYCPELSQWKNVFHLKDDHRPENRLGKIKAKGILLAGTGEHIRLENTDFL